ncbi:HNH endonuclease [Methylobacterium sp. NMS14P]|uniref:HNH endonuclease signature motif containing protein n=1 Tax=Methylobacterium sp. NMS14P TaxID=2894310 RepID=UPI0023587ADF|nr:HNH endonuclease signature motif containing protein [Methylobacterium sp. NMS14P]WCS27270.1 HNH endonuclease [Methylobacterium sp. NMS14P]
MPRPLPSLDELSALYSYDPEAGVIRLKVRRSTSPAGKEFRSISNQGYVVVSPTINGIRHHMFAHRLAWALYSGSHPPRDMLIDHINRDRADNRIANLRLVDPYGNSINSARTRKPSHVPKYVSQLLRHGKIKYQVSGCAGGKVFYRGIFDSLEEASRVAGDGGLHK